MEKQNQLSVYYAIALAKLYNGTIAIITEKVNGEDVYVTAYTKLCSKFYINDLGHYVTTLKLKSQQCIHTFKDITLAKQYLQQLHITYTDIEKQRIVRYYLQNNVLCISFKDILQKQAYCVCLQKVDMQDKYVSYKAYDAVTQKPSKDIALIPLSYFYKNVSIQYTYFMPCPNWQRGRNKIGSYADMLRECKTR
jgi:hypothetical protein